MVLSFRYEGDEINPRIIGTIKTVQIAISSFLRCQISSNRFFTFPFRCQKWQKFTLEIRHIFFFISNPPFCICSYCRPTAITYTFFFHYQYYNFAREYSSSNMRGFFSPFQTSEYIAYFRIQILKNDNKTFFSPFVHLRNLETFADTECQC